MAHPRDAVWSGTEALQRQLADVGAHQCATPVDLLVAVVARQPVRRILG
ncbi:hypothetical protein [Streptomyces virginiae]